MMLHGSQNRQRQNILRSRTRETSGCQEQKGGSEWRLQVTSRHQMILGETKDIRMAMEFLFWTPSDS